MMKRMLPLFLAAALVAGGSVAQAKPKGKQPEVKNVIFMIGDGMGLPHMQVSSMRSGAPLAIERAQYVGLAKTHSVNNRVTDSAAAGTAMATGTKTYNSAIGVDADKNPLKNIRERAQESGRSTGIVVTSEITHATPAAFLAHRPSRKEGENIALDIVASGVDVFMGGGRNHFEVRKDMQNLSDQLRAKGYTIAYTLEEAQAVNDGKLGVLMSDKAMPKMSEGRGNYLPLATQKAIDLLSKNKKGFFLMVEGSFIDGGGHRNDVEYVIAETLDFDQAVKVAFDFADRNPGTLVVVAADHETGGLTIPSGNEDFMLGDKGIKFMFSTGGHTGVMVPVYAYGTGAENFSRIMDNTDLPKKMAGLMKLK